MENEWNREVQRVIQVGERVGVTLSNEMLRHINVVIGESVHVEMRDDELVIKKIVSLDSPDGLSIELMQKLQEIVDEQGGIFKSLKS